MVVDVLPEPEDDEPEDDEPEPDEPMFGHGWLAALPVPPLPEVPVGGVVVEDDPDPDAVAIAELPVG